MTASGYAPAPNYAPPPAYDAPWSPADTSAAQVSKYIRVDGITQLNPAYAQTHTATTALYPKEALYTVTTPQEAAQLATDAAAHGATAPLAASVAPTYDVLHEPAAVQNIGLSAGETVNHLAHVFNKFEIPLGLMNKLVTLTEYDHMEFIVDDSGSMACHSDTKINGQIQTRWQEAVGGASALVTFICVLCTLRTQISRSICNFTHYSTCA
jgi:hypothetical protein